MLFPSSTKPYWLVIMHGRLLGPIDDLRCLTHLLHLLMQALDADHVFISHSHIDHIGALLSHARARTLGNKPARYYVPEEAVEPLMKVREGRDARL